jgi:translation initiation factor 3 subunit B
MENLVAGNSTLSQFLSIRRYIFLEYDNPEAALAAVKSVNNYKLDKAHTFKVNLFTDFEKLKNISDDWEPPEPLPYPAAKNLHSYLLNRDCYEQFSVLSGNAGDASVQIWLNSIPNPTSLEERNVSTFT